LRKEINIELNVAKQELSTFMQDVNKNNQEVRESFCRSELANTQTFAEIDREIADLREQISRVANNTSVQHYKSALTVECQVQPSQSSNSAD
jgi:hypothetical protein